MTTLWAIDLKSELVFVGDEGTTERRGPTRRRGIEAALRGQVWGPIYINGTFAKPDYGIDKKNLAEKLGSSVLLGLLNPLAAGRTAGLLVGAPQMSRSNKGRTDAGASGESWALTVLANVWP